MVGRPWRKLRNGDGFFSVTRPPGGGFPGGQPGGGGGFPGGRPSLKFGRQVYMVSV